MTLAYNRPEGSMDLSEVLQSIGRTQADMARGTSLSKTAANAIVQHDRWPRRRTGEVRKRVAMWFRENGANPAQLRSLMPSPANKLPPPGLQPGEGVSPATAVATTHEEEDSMLLRNAVLTPAAKKLFGLRRSPFVDDIQTRDDVFLSRGYYGARAALQDAALNHGFVALVGESGSGKSTVVEEFEEEQRERAGAQQEIVVIKPYTLAMEEDDNRGKTLKAGQIAEAVLRTLAPGIPVKSRPEAYFAQIHEALRAGYRAGSRHLLVIEEAHCMPTPTLKHLKRFLELKDGRARLIGVALIGQPELERRLSERDERVREVVQRCEIVRMEALDDELETYIAHKFGRVGAKPESVFEADAYEAIRARLQRIPRGGTPADAVSLCYPLVVNNLVTRAMNEAAETGFDRVSAEILGGC